MTNGTDSRAKAGSSSRQQMQNGSSLAVPQPQDSPNILDSLPWFAAVLKGAEATLAATPEDQQPSWYRAHRARI